VTSLKYIWRNVTRHKLRSSLTVLSIGFSLALLTVLLGYMATLDTWGGEAEKHNRLVVLSKQGFAGSLPMSMVDKFREIPSVKDVVPFSWYGGQYKDEPMAFAQFATDPRHVTTVWDEYKFDPAQLAEWQNDRQGCLVDKHLAEKRGWVIGDRIPLQGTYYQFDLDLKICGFFEAPVRTDSVWFNYLYLDEGLKAMSARGVGRLGTIYLKAENSAAIPGIIQAVDNAYASSNDPTKTQTEAAFAQMFTDMMGGIKFFILVIGAVVVFALTLVAANAMAMSTRERTTEMAVLKAIGFTRPRVLRLILGESCMVAMIGGLLGLAMGCGLLELLHATAPRIFPFQLHEFAGLWLGWLAVIAGFVGLAAGIVPAVLAARRSVVDGLRRVI
jgi:putative ABC transport system permease protein